MTLTRTLQGALQAAGVDSTLQLRIGDAQVAITCDDAVLIRRERGSARAAPSPVLAPALRQALPELVETLGATLRDGLV